MLEETTRNDDTKSKEAPTVRLLTRNKSVDITPIGNMLKLFVERSQLNKLSGLRKSIKFIEPIFQNKFEPEQSKIDEDDVPKITISNSDVKSSTKHVIRQIKKNKMIIEINRKSK